MTAADMPAVSGSDVPARPTSLAEWAWVPRIGARVKANHPLTPLNPETTFEVIAVRAEPDGRFAARGENTCWFGVGMLAASPPLPQEQGAVPPQGEQR